MLNLLPASTIDPRISIGSTFSPALSKLGVCMPEKIEPKTDRPVTVVRMFQMVETHPGNPPDE